jgi:hypothetical protein
MAVVNVRTMKDGVGHVKQDKKLQVLKIVVKEVSIGL